jgi:hypothetical protein
MYREIGARIIQALGKSTQVIKMNTAHSHSGTMLDRWFVSMVCGRALGSNAMQLSFSDLTHELYG